MKPLGDWVSVCPWRSRLVLIVLINGVGENREATSLTDKRTLLARKDGTMLVFWPGQYSSSAREITLDERDVVLAAL